MRISGIVFFPNWKILRFNTFRHSSLIKTAVSFHQKPISFTLPHALIDISLNRRKIMAFKIRKFCRSRNKTEREVFEDIRCATKTSLFYASTQISAKTKVPQEENWLLWTKVKKSVWIKTGIDQEVTKNLSWSQNLQNVKTQCI